MQRVLLITIIFILTGVLALILIYRPSSDSDKAAISDKKIGQGSLLRQFGNSETENPLTRISTHGVSSFSIAPGGKEIFYFNKNGQFTVTDFIGTRNDSVPQSLDGELLQAIWSPTNLQAILTLASNRGLEKILYDFQNGEAHVLNKNIQNISFGPDGTRIAYNFYDALTGEGNISISKSDGTMYVNIFKTRLSDVDIFWPSEDLIAFHKISPEKEADLFSINNKGENFEKILSDKKGLKVNWPVSKKEFVFSEKSDEIDRLYYTNLETKTTLDLNLKTAADQCVWSKNTINIICYADNNIYEINTADGSKETIRTLPENIRAKSLALSPLEDYLVFINREDEQLYSLLLR